MLLPSATQCLPDLSYSRTKCGMWHLRVIWNSKTIWPQNFKVVSGTHCVIQIQLFSSQCNGFCTGPFFTKVSGMLFLGDKALCASGSLSCAGRTVTHTRMNERSPCALTM